MQLYINKTKILNKIICPTFLFFFFFFSFPCNVLILICWPKNPHTNYSPLSHKASYLHHLVYEGRRIHPLLSRSLNISSGISPISPMGNFSWTLQSFQEFQLGKGDGSEGWRSTTSQLIDHRDHVGLHVNASVVHDGSTKKSSEWSNKKNNP